MYSSSVRAATRRTRTPPPANTRSSSAMFTWSRPQIRTSGSASRLTALPLQRSSPRDATYRAETRAPVGRRREAARGVCRIRSLGGGRCPPPTALAAKPRRSPFGERIGPASPQDTSGVGGPATTEDDGMRRSSATALAEHPAEPRPPHPIDPDHPHAGADEED